MRLIIFSTLLFFPWLLASVHAQQSLPDNIALSKSNIAIDGYSPVSYFEKGIAERGDPGFAVEHGGRVYYLASAGQAAKFSAAPEQYKPLFDVCPYSLSLGRKVSIDPTRFKIVAGRLLLFHNSAELDALRAWNEKDDDLGQLNQARRNYGTLQNSPIRDPGNSDNLLDMDF